ncbi:MAG TPA: pyridoxine 5'-phosphate synthase [candidate division Zixibacteria bacterium]|nr:pyridoxine 5'-phosphate synthase [candidate division Zixibacteria bacterium]
MSSLTVNVNLIAMLRELRRLEEPDPAQAAVLAELNGAEGIAVQVRRDRRFVRERDLYVLQAVAKTKLVVELPAADDLIGRMMEIKPHTVVFAADQPDLEAQAAPIDFSAPQVDFRDLTERLAAVGVQVAYLVEPEADQIKGASKARANAVLIDCGGYTRARRREEAQRELDRIDEAGRLAAKAELTVMLGRGITYRNVAPLAELGYVDDFVIGQAIAGRGMLVGFGQAVREMAALVRRQEPTAN